MGIFGKSKKEREKEYMNKLDVKKLYQILKTVTKWWIILYIIGCTINFLGSFLVEWPRHNGWALEGIVNNALGLKRTRYPFIITPKDTVFNFDKNNLFEYECKDSPHKDAVYEMYQNEVYKDLKLTLDETKQLYCLQFRAGSTSPFTRKDLKKELCDTHSPGFCKIVALKGNSWILKAGLLPEVVKILERPCDYIAKSQEGLDGIGKQDLSWHMTSLRCKSSILPKFLNPYYQYTILELWDEENKEQYDIVVKRKDF